MQDLKTKKFDLKQIGQREAAIRAKKQADEAELVADTFIDFTNSSVADIDTFVATVTGCHRTLQQSAMRVFMTAIRRWAELHDAGRYDLRNEATCKLAKAIMEAVEDRDGLPFV